MEANKNLNNRNAVMDAMRGIASMWVALHHFDTFGGTFKPDFWKLFCEYGTLGVIIFFVISGWCMAMITERERSWLTFVTKRICRIFPPYWLSLATVVAVAVVLHFWIGGNDEAEFPKGPFALLATLTLMTKPATGVPTINWVYWTLTYEVMFYVLVTIGLVCRKPAWFLVILMPMSLVKIIWFPSSSPGGVLFFADQYPYFMLGFLAHTLRGKARAIGVTGIFFVVWFRLSGAGWLDLALALGSAALLLGSEAGGGRSKVWLRPLAKIGDWSYGLYLIHVPIGVFLLMRFRSQAILDNTAYHVAYNLAALGICIFLAWIVHVTVEQPSHRAGQWLAAKLKSKRETPGLIPA